MKFIVKEVKCKVCGNVAPILRKKGKNRKAGHIKHTHCIVCNSRTEHIELMEI